MTASAPHLTQIDAIAAAVRDGIVTDEQIVRLDRLLAGNLSAQRYYLDYISLCVGLDFRGVAGAEGSEPRRSALVNPRLFRWAIRFTAAAAIVLVFTAALSVLIDRAPRQRSDVPVATIVDAHDAVWGDSDVPTAVGSQLPGGTLRLQSGTARIEFFSGAQVTLTGPAVFGLNSEMRGFLRHGTLTAYCPPSAHGFTIAAPGCSVIDLGTEFTAAVGPDGRTLVKVIRGQVLVKSGTDGKTRRLFAAQAIEVDHGLGEVIVERAADRPIAEGVPAFRFSNSTYDAKPIHFSLGYRFTTAADLDVTALGMLDFQGRSIDAAGLQVALYPAGGGPAIIGPVTVTAADTLTSEAPTNEDGPMPSVFRYHKLPNPVMLKAGQYQITATTGRPGKLLQRFARNAVGLSSAEMLGPIQLDMPTFTKDTDLPVFSKDVFPRNQPGNFGPNFMAAPHTKNTAGNPPTDRQTLSKGESP